MTRKHYIQLALMLQRNVPDCKASRHMKWSLVRDMCMVLKSDNPRFQDEKFTDMATQFDLLPENM